MNRPAHLLTTQNAKTVKGEKLGYLTGVLYMLPHTLASKKSLCPFSTAGCRATCLNTAGRGRFDKTQQARYNKTLWFNDDINSFMDRIYGDIEALKRKAAREGLKPAVRLNGTTDIRYEYVRWNSLTGWKREDHTIQGTRNIFSLFPDVQFYDYTAYPYHKRETNIKNYDLTYSIKETTESEQQAYTWIRYGHNIAMVFAPPPPEMSIMNIKGLDLVVVNGDKHDLTFTHRGPVLLALKAKGKAKKDVTGFVRRGWQM
jgi:hypothetical protein